MMRRVLSGALRPSLRAGGPRLPFRSAHVDRRPTLAEVDYLCRNIREISNESLATLAYLEVAPATREWLIREVMRVDGTEWPAAAKRVEEICTVNHKWAFVQHTPHLIGALLGLVGAFVSIPMVFDRSTAVWFNNAFVTYEEPEWEKVNTCFEVGNWTWAWMEPLTGTASFFLLGLQFARANMQNLQVRPYTVLVQTLRANRLARLFPQYDPEVVKAFARNHHWSLVDAH